MVMHFSAHHGKAAAIKVPVFLNDNTGNGSATKKSQRDRHAKRN